MTLLVLLTWYLLCLTFIASSLSLLSLLLSEKNKKFSKWSSWIAFALGCLAVVTVVITAGYLGMRFRLRSTIQESCLDFGMTNNPLSKSENVSDIALVMNYLLSDFPEVAKWTSWVALALCAVAVLSFIVFVVILLKEDDKKFLDKIPPLKAKKEFAYKNFNDYDSDIKIISGKYKKLSSDSSKPKSSLSSINYATFGLLSAALIWVVLLNYFVGLEEQRIVPLCVPKSLDDTLFEHRPLLEERIGGYHFPQKDPFVEDKVENHTITKTRLFFVSRKEWSAVTPRDFTALQHPVEHVVISYTQGEPCSSRSACMDAIRNLQQTDMDGNGWWDILQNFLVAGDNRVYEGRGWDIQGLPKDRFGNGSLVVSFVGRFMHQLPPAYQLRTFNKLINEGIRLGKISSLYKLVIDSNIVGSILEKELHNWDHYFPQK